MPSVLKSIQEKARELWQEHNLLDEDIDISARTLSIEEAIGNPMDKDFPLQTGKERLMEANFRGSKGQAFTDRYGNYQGNLRSIAEMELTDNFQRAIFVAALNATMRYLGLTDRTIHCRDEEPGRCAEALAKYIREKYGDVKIVQAGFQPKMVEALGKDFDYRIIDLDPENIGKKLRGVLVEGPDTAAAALDWAELLVVTGTTLANDTIGDFLGRCPIIFYGTTIAGAAALMGWGRFCAESK